VAGPDSDITIRSGPTYERELRRAKLGKLTAVELSDIWAGILVEFTVNPQNPAVPKAGTAIPRNNREIYKIRVGDPDRNKGKQGSYRLIYWWRSKERELIGLFFYHKSEREDVPQNEIDAARKAIIGQTT
jgi:mRNA-degrading endonuclease RelE of RelBE toxin-antitoxin system